MDSAREWVNGANATGAASPKAYGELEAGSRKVCFLRGKKSARELMSDKPGVREVQGLSGSASSPRVVLELVADRAGSAHPELENHAA
jgi:hypothetical protein